MDIIFSEIKPLQTGTDHSLFDVRDPERPHRLLGYSRYEPERDGLWFSKSGYEAQFVRTMLLSFDVRPPHSNDHVVRKFMCWMVSNPQVDALIARGWLLQAGPDRLDEFVGELRRQERERILGTAWIMFPGDQTTSESPDLPVASNRRIRIE